jgi:[ribosomal protein S5]-alanine N-acetyltransferase
MSSEASLRIDKTVTGGAAVHKEIQGEKTKLRPASWGFGVEDLRRRFLWSEDDQLQYWSGTIPGGRTFAQFCETVALRDWPPDGKRISYAITSRHDELIGMVSCYNIDSRHAVGEIGIYLGEKAYWGRGYGTDALITFLRHLFTNLGFEAVYLHTYESNLRAKRSYARAGFAPAEKRRRYSPRLGYHEEVRMGIDRESFDRQHGLAPVAAAT